MLVEICNVDRGPVPVGGGACWPESRPHANSLLDHPWGNQPIKLTYQHSTAPRALIAIRLSGHTPRTVFLLSTVSIQKTLYHSFIQDKLSKMSCDAVQIGQGLSFAGTAYKSAYHLPAWKRVNLKLVRAFLLLRIFSTVLFHKKSSNSNDVRWDISNYGCLQYCNLQNNS